MFLLSDTRKTNRVCLSIIIGVAFEQGKFLPTPETVPFRLTRDLVDGMGLTGVEGVFRRCCEKTMQVMRTSQESLMTIVEVRAFFIFVFFFIVLYNQTQSSYHPRRINEPYGGKKIDRIEEEEEGKGLVKLSAIIRFGSVI